MFGKVVAVNNLSFSVETGTIHALVGPNGSGKTTTLRIAAGLLRPDNGVVSVFGKPVGRDGGRGVIGYMPESPSFRGEATAVELLNLHLRLLGLPDQAHDEVVEQLLESVGLLEQSNMELAAYTKGMRQRLGLALALVGKPSLLILDEPTAGLDPTGVIKFRALLRGLVRDGAAILISTHDLDEVERLCDEVTILEGGQAVVSGRLEEIQQKIGTSLLEVELQQVNENIVRALRSLPFVEGLSLEGKAILIRVSTSGDPRSAISKTVASCGGIVLSLHSSVGRMEDAFLHFVAAKDRKADASVDGGSSRAQRAAVGGVRSVVHVTGDCQVGGHIMCSIDIVNVGSTPVWLTKVEEVIPEGVRLEDIPSRFDSGKRTVALGDTKLDPLQSRTLQVGLLGERTCRFEFSPRVHYVNDVGERRVHISGSIVLEVTNRDAVQPDAESSKKVLEFLKSEFLRDSLDLNLNRESAGWRSVTQIARGTAVSASTLYGRNGHFGTAIAELLGKGAIESKMFRNQRGRGGEVVRFRIRYELDWIRRDIEQRESTSKTRPPFTNERLEVEN